MRKVLGKNGGGVLLHSRVIDPAQSGDKLLREGPGEEPEGPEGHMVWVMIMKRLWEPRRFRGSRV